MRTSPLPFHAIVYGPLSLRAELVGPARLPFVFRTRVREFRPLSFQGDVTVDVRARCSERPQMIRDANGSDARLVFEPTTWRYRQAQIVKHLLWHSY